MCTVCKLSTLFYRRQGSVDKTSCILCSFCALCREVSNFVSNNCESLAGFTRSGCFNRSVKRKNVGLECNVFDSLDYVLDGSRFLLDVLNCFKKLLLQQLGIIRLVANTPTSQNQALLKLISGIGNKEIPVEGLLAWADLYPVIDKLYDGFYSRMMEKFGQVLSDKEVQICCLLCAGFSTKEIGVVTQQTSATIYVRKTSIRKKINAGEKQDIVECIRGI